MYCPQVRWRTLKVSNLRLDHNVVCYIAIIIDPATAFNLHVAMVLLCSEFELLWTVELNTSQYNAYLLRYKYYCVHVCNVYMGPAQQE